MLMPTGPAVNPFGGADLADEHLHHASLEYLLRFGWHTVVVGKELRFALGQQVAGVVMPATAGEHTNSLLGMWGVPSPVLCVPRSQRRWVFLAEPDDSVPVDLKIPVPRATPRAGVLPLPPSITADGEVSWVIAPGEEGVSMPNLSTLVTTVNRMTSDYRLVM